MLQYLSWNLLYKNTIPIKFPSKTPQVNINVWPSPWKDLLHPLQLVSWCNKHPRPTTYSPSWDPLVSNRREQLGKTAWSRDRFTHGPNEGQSLYHFWVKASLVPHRKTLEKKTECFSAQNLNGMRSKAAARSRSWQSHLACFFLPETLPHSQIFPDWPRHIEAVAAVAFATIWLASEGPCSLGCFRGISWLVPGCGWKFPSDDHVEAMMSLVYIFPCSASPMQYTQAF